MRSLLTLVGGLVLAATTVTPALAATPPVNDEQGGALALQLEPGTPSTSLQQDAAGATASVTDPSCGEGPSLWYSYTPAANQWVSVRAATSTGQPAVGVYTGSPEITGSLGCDAPPPGSTTSDGVTLVTPFVPFEATAGTTYYVVVSRAGGTLTVNLSAREAPAPLTQAVFTPSTISRLADGSLRVDATLTCDAAGYATLDLSAAPVRARRGAPTAFGSASVPCLPSQQPVSVVLQSFGDFHGGPTTVSTQVTAGQYGLLGNPVDRVQTSQQDDLRLTVARRPAMRLG